MRSVLKFCAFFILPFYLSACFSWRSAGLSNLRETSAKGKTSYSDVYRFETLQGKKVKFHGNQFVLEGDQVLVKKEGVDRPLSDAETQNLQKQQWHAAKTAGVIVGGVAGVLALAFIISLATMKD